MANTSQTTATNTAPTTGASNPAPARIRAADDKRPIASLAGLSPAQIERLMYAICAMASNGAEVCRDQAEVHGESSAATYFHTLAAMFDGIGALADAPLGGMACGSYNHWAVGPLWNESNEGGAA